MALDQVTVQAVNCCIVIHHVQVFIFATLLPRVVRTENQSIAAARGKRSVNMLFGKSFI